MAYFKLKQKGTNLKTEMIAGLTAYMTMAYIIFVNPAILSQGGMTGVSFESIVLATCLGSGIMSVAMGLISNTPFVLASGIAINSLVLFTIIYGLGLDFSQAMGIVITGGILVAILAVTRLRKMVTDAIPAGLKYAMVAAIGLFLVFFGARQGGFIVNDPNIGISLGDLTKNYTLLAIFGLVLTILLVSFKVKGGILLGILGTVAAGIIFKVLPLPESIISIPRKESLQTFFTADPIGAFWKEGMLDLAALTMVFVLMMTDFFDTLGIAIGVGQRAGLMDKEGRIGGLKRLLVVDSLASIMGGFLGAGVIHIQPESSSGVAEGGRSGIVPVVSGIIFLLSAFFAPFISIVGGGVEAEGMYLYPVTAPALIVAGILMLKAVARIDFRDPDIGLPAFFTIAIMPVTYNITYGIGLGFISYTIIKVIRRRFSQLNPVMVVVSLLFVLSFVIESIIMN